MTNNTAVVSSDLKVKFIAEVERYITELNLAINEEPKMLFGNPVPVQMPKHNTTDILNKYIELSTVELQSTGLRKQRAKSISKYTLEKILSCTLRENGC
jgi:hypothetical protein